MSSDRAICLFSNRMSYMQLLYVEIVLRHTCSRGDAAKPTFLRYNTSMCNGVMKMQRLYNRVFGHK